MSKKIRSLRMLITYLVCYISIAVLCSGLVGGILYYYSYHSIQTQLETEHEKRLEYAAKTMLNQIELLLSMKNNISSHQEFLPSQLKKGNYFEEKMLESFRYFSGYTEAFSRYYLYYRDSGRVYSVQFTYSIDLFLQFMGLDEVPELRKAMEHDQNLTTLRNPYKDEIYFVLPLNIGSSDWKEYNASLLLITNKNTILSYLKQMLVMDSEDVSISINGQQIMGGPAETRYFGDAETLKYRVIVSSANLPGEESLHAYRFYGPLAIVAVTCLGALAASYLAMRNYRPIRKLSQRTAKYTISGDNELDRINKLIDAMDTEIESMPKITEGYTEKLKKITDMLRNRTLYGLLNSDVSEFSFDSGAGLNDIFPYPYFQVVSLQSSQKDTRKIAELLNGFYEDGYICYALESYYQVELIINSVSLPRLREAVGIIQEMAADSFSAPMTVYEGIPCQGVEEIPLSRLLARSRSEEDTSGEKQISLVLHDKYIEHILHAVRTGDFASAEDRLRHLDRILTEDASEDVSLLTVQYLWMDILNQVIHLALEKQIQLPETLIGKAMLSIKTNQAMENVIRVAEYICDQISEDSMEFNESMAKEVQAYVDQHWMDSQFTIDQVADELNISPRTVGHLIRRKTGVSYKEYIIALRINTAKDELIHTDKSIAEICEQVGYASLPHFIRMFRQATSYSPGEFRRIMRKA